MGVGGIIPHRLDGLDFLLQFGEVVGVAPNLSAFDDEVLALAAGDPVARVAVQPPLPAPPVRARPRHAEANPAANSRGAMPDGSNSRTHDAPGSLARLWRF
jgi:hypothetical protein